MFIPKKKKVLHVLSCIENGGTENFVFNQIKHTKDVTFDILVFTNSCSNFSRFETLGCNIIHSCLPSIGNLFRFILNFVTVIKQHGPYDVVHSHVNIQNSWVMLAAKLAGVKNRFSHSHAVFARRRSCVQKLYDIVQIVIIKLFATHYLACGEIAGKSLYGEKTFENKGIIIHNAIDVSAFLNSDYDTQHLRKTFNIYDDSVVVGNITRFDQNKNTLFTIDVFSELLKKIPNAILLLGGPDGGLLSTARNYVEKKGIQQSVRFIGSRDDVPQCLQLINVYLFPSITEGLGIAVLEAQCSACLCFASSSIPKETDIGLNSIHYIPLSWSARKWSTIIIDKLNGWTQPNKDMITRAFVRRGYDINNANQILSQLYMQ